MAELVIIRKAVAQGDLMFVFDNGEIKKVNKPSKSNSVSLKLPKQFPEDTFTSFNIDLGVEKELIVNFRLYKQNFDRSNGTYTTPVQTFGEIITYLEDWLLWTGIGTTKYEITISDKYRTRTDQYTLKDWDIDVDSDIYPKGFMVFEWDRKIV